MRLLERARERQLHLVSWSSPPVPIGQVWVDPDGNAWRITRHTQDRRGWAGIRHWGVPA